MLEPPYFLLNLKTYLWGDDLLDLLREADEIASGLRVSLMAAPIYVDIRAAAGEVENMLVLAQHLDPQSPGMGTGAVPARALEEAGADGVMLNHAEKKMKLQKLSTALERAGESGLLSLVLTDSVSTARAAAVLGPDIILTEPPDLIGTGRSSDEEYMRQTVKAVEEIDSGIAVMQGGGISSPADVDQAVRAGAAGIGATSAITEADSPLQILEKLLKALESAWQARR